MNLKGITANAKVLNLIKEWNDGYYIAETFRNGHYLIRNKFKVYYVVFKKDYFNSFNKWFNETEGITKADSLNIEAINRAIRYDAELLIIHDEVIYKAYPMQIKRYIVIFSKL